MLYRSFIHHEMVAKTETEYTRAHQQMRYLNVTWRITFSVYLFTTELRQTCRPTSRIFLSRLSPNSHLCAKMNWLDIKVKGSKVKVAITPNTAKNPLVRPFLVTIFLSRLSPNSHRKNFKIFAVWIWQFEFDNFTLISYSHHNPDEQNVTR